MISLENKKISQKKMRPPIDQDLRTWALQTLIWKEGHLDSKMYAVADLYIGINNAKNTEVLYTLWNGWKSNHPDTKYKL
tara:strand:- start:512 stop:748 length:237 start_codon:yes stop_codon:yes gene_type:complete